MAFNTSKLGGYLLNFFSEPPDALVCPICKYVARDPHQMDCCGRVYCQLCLSEHNKHSDTCPQCWQTGNSFADKRCKYCHFAHSETDIQYTCAGAIRSLRRSC